MQLKRTSRTWSEPKGSGHVTFLPYGEVMTFRPKGLWVVQLLEYGIGFTVANIAVRSQDPVAPALLAIALVVNAATVKGPLSAFHLTSGNLHRTLGLAIALAALGCALFVPMSAMDRITLVVVAMAEAFVSVRFRHGI